MDVDKFWVTFIIGLAVTAIFWWSVWLIRFLFILMN